MKEVVDVHQHLICPHQLVVHLVAQLQTHRILLAKIRVRWINNFFSDKIVHFYESLFTDQSRTSAPSRAKKATTTGNTTTKKNISMVKEEDEDAIQQVEIF